MKKSSAWLTQALLFLGGPINALRPWLYWAAYFLYIHPIAG